MKSYPKIDGVNASDKWGEHCHAFYKYDGSNIRAEWSRKRGWYKFGTRKQMIDKSTPFWSQAISAWESQLADPLDRIFREDKAYKNCQSVVAFAEFFGESSFAGSHVEEEVKKIVLFDISPHKMGMLPPDKFIRDFAAPLGEKAAEVLYSGKLIPEIVESVRSGKLGSYEGAIFKGGHTTHNLWMAKVKNREWVTRVKEQYQCDWRNYHDERDE